MSKLVLLVWLRLVWCVYSNRKVLRNKAVERNWCVALLSLSKVHQLLQLLISKSKVRHSSTVNTVCVDDGKDRERKRAVLYLNLWCCTYMAPEPPGSICSLTFNDIHIQIFHIQSHTQLLEGTKTRARVPARTINNSLAEGGKKQKQSFFPATRIDNDKSTSSHLSSVEIGVEASFPFLSHLAVCVMFICSYTVSALLPDSRAAPKLGACISREDALLAAERLNVKGVCAL